MTSTKSHSGVARVGTTGTLIASERSQLGGETAQHHGHVCQVHAANRSPNRSVDAAEHIACASFSKRIWECGAQTPEGGIDDQESEHMADVESLKEMRSAVLRYRREEGRSSE